MTDKVYLDSNIIIYYVEGAQPLHDRIDAVLKTYVNQGDGFITSEITLGECLIGVGKKPHLDKKAYLSVLDDPAFISLAAVTSEIIRRAAVLGAQFNMKLIDAIHVATAETLECKTFMTNDRGIRAPAGLELRYLSAEA